VVIAQSDAFNASAISTVLVAIITSNLLLGQAPGNIVLAPRDSKLKRKSVINVSQLFTVDNSLLSDRISRLSDVTIHRLDDGLKLVLALR
jgi:mRNA interferase MazF